MWNNLFLIMKFSIWIVKKEAEHFFLDLVYLPLQYEHMRILIFNTVYITRFSITLFVLSGTKVWFETKIYLFFCMNEYWPNGCYEHFLSNTGWERQKCDLPFVFTSHVYFLLLSRAASGNKITTTIIININAIDCLKFLFFLMLITIKSMTMLTKGSLKAICH